MATACPKCGSTAIHEDAEVDPELPYTCTACFLAFDDDDVRRKYGNIPDVLSEGQSEGAPLAVGEIIGWRAWYVKDYGSGPRLSSTPNGVIPTVFEPGKIMRAQCPAGHANPPQEGQHCCGFYAAVSREQLVQLGYNNYRLGDPQGDTVVIGQVALAGKVIPGTQGWRAAEAWPVCVYVPYDKWQMVRPLRDAYNIPIVLDKTLGQGQGY